MTVNTSSIPLKGIDRPFPDLTSQSTHVTRQRFYELAPDEEKWRDRYSFLLNRGLELRPRYAPGWVPSWLGTNLDPECCEDSKMKTLYPVLDARRRDNGTSVCIKRIAPKTEDPKDAKIQETEIGKYLSTEHMLRDPANHCVPILDNFLDPGDPEVEYIVMPVLRPFNDPDLCVIGEVVDFVSQILEGMNFIHQHLVAHGDLTAQNIMMDAHPILPRGWHFVEDQCMPNGVDPIAPLARIDHPVRYVIVDYDQSLRLQPGQSPLVQDFGGQDSDPPELHTLLPCDAFKLDVFTVGNVFEKSFYAVYEGLDFLKAQIDTMKTPDFRSRPNAQIALERWLDTKSKLDVSIARWRLRKRNESVGERALLDAIAVARGGIQSVKNLLSPQPQVRTWSNP